MKLKLYSLTEHTIVKFQNSFKCLPNSACSFDNNFKSQRTYLKHPKFHWYKFRLFGPQKKTKKVKGYIICKTSQGRKK